MQVIIMAGGEGSRLRPLTCDRPKPMVPLVNKPVMEHTVDLLKNIGWTDIGVTLQYLPDDIMDYFGDGTDFGVNMKYFIEEVPLGTAGSVKNSGDFLKETFLVISGDALTDFDLQKALEFHRAKKSWATLVLKRVSIPLEYGVVITSGDFNITRFLEKPGWGEVFSDTVNTGIYILEPEVLQYIPQNKKFDFSKDLFPLLMLEGKPMYGYLAEGYWCDIGSLEQYQQANFDVMTGKAKITNLKENLYSDNVWLGQNVLIRKGARIEGPVIIGDNTVIEDGAQVGPYTVLGAGCRIAEYASVKRSVLWDGVDIGPMTEIRGAVVCSQVTTGAKSRIFEGAVLGDRVKLQNMVKINPNIKIWPDKSVEKQTVLRENLVWGQFSTRNIFGNQGVSGQVNTEILPEWSARLGAAFGASASKGGKIAVSSDGTPASEMVRLGLMSGLLSVGCRVVDIGKVSVPVHRFAIRTTGFDGGIHVNMAGGVDSAVVIRLSDHRGIPISRAMERKIESNLQREDFPRAHGAKIGMVEHLPEVHRPYISTLVNMANAEKIRRKRPTVIGLHQAMMTDILADLADHLGVQLISIPTEEVSGVGREKLLQELKQKVAAKEADFGFLLEGTGEGLELVDETGRILNKDDYLVLTAAMLLHKGPDVKVAVPVTLSGILEEVAQKSRGQVVRTKTSPQKYFEELFREDIAKDQYIPQYMLAFDGLAGMVGIIDFLATENTNLATFFNSLPKTYGAQKTVPCGWEDKGKVMRNLIEEHADSKVETVDGIKVFLDNGWALILPDVEKPIYHVYTESNNYEMAESLADFYVDKISKVLNQDGECLTGKQKGLSTT